MSMRSPAGFISAFFDPLKNPDAPTNVAAAGGDSSASVSFTPPTNVGGSAVSAYYAVANDGTTVSGAASPVTVTGLTNGTAYTFSVWALNTYGPSAFSAASGSVTPAAAIGVFGGGNPSSSTRITQYVTIATTSNTSSWGDLSGGDTGAGMGSTTRGIFLGAANIEYITFASQGNAVYFGAMNPSRVGMGAASNATRGLMGAGDTSGSYLSSIEYITIATTGGDTYFGNLTLARTGVGALSSPTRAVFAGGAAYVGGWQHYSTIDYVEIATTGNAAGFGSLSSDRGFVAACSSSTRGVFAGGGTVFAVNTSAMQYITIATTGTITSFGSLSDPLQSMAGTSNNTRGIFGGGRTDTFASPVSGIQYIQIASTGNTSTFGSLLYAAYGMGACGNASGGVQ